MRPGGPPFEPAVSEVTPAEAATLRERPDIVLVYVREDDEWAAGHIPGAIHLAMSRLPSEVNGSLPDTDAPLVIYCAHGVRSLVAGAALQRMGYPQIVSMAGGFVRWAAQGLPIERPANGPGGLRVDQQERYARQIRMPEVGLAGQQRLLRSRVLIVGAGGLGSPAALYLAAAGVGTLRIVDFDNVEISNLQRQVVHSTERLGQPKATSAEAAVRALNPDVRVEAVREALTAANAAPLVDGCDAILDATDSFETRYALNDAAVATGVPLVHASVFRFEGQLSTFVPGEGPCYRCLHPEPPPPELAPACSVVGVLGVVPGVMGMLQATEVLKLLLGIGEPLVGRLLLFDALAGSFDEIRIRRDPECPACGSRASPATVRATAREAPAEVHERGPASAIEPAPASG